MQTMGLRTLMSLTLFTDGSISVADPPPPLPSETEYRRQGAQRFEMRTSSSSNNRADDRSRSPVPTNNKIYMIDVQIGPTSSRASGKGVGSKAVASEGRNPGNPDEAGKENEWEFLEEAN